jgi:hypothetical protein
MRVAVIGSRTFNDYALLQETLSHVHISEMISGGALGADQLAEQYANEHNIPLKVIPHQHNPDIADLSRTYSIINLAQLVIAFWDGKSQGTCDLIKYAQKKGKPVKIQNFRAGS